jgi:hypothetical protein
MAVVQLRNPTDGRTYFDAKKAAGKTPMEAIRALKRRLSNIVYAPMLADQKRREATGPGGHWGTTLQSNVTDLTPDAGSSDKAPGSGTGRTGRDGSAVRGGAALRVGDRQVRPRQQAPLARVAAILLATGTAVRRHGKDSRPPSRSPRPT